MNFDTISVGYAVPNGDFEASVHSVFKSAINLRLHGKNGLITLIASGEGDLPQGIRLNAPKDFSFETFQIGAPAYCRDGILHFEKNSLTVQLSGAHLWKCDLPGLRFDLTDPEVSAAWNTLWEALNRRQRLTGSEIVAEELFLIGTSPRAGIPRTIGAAMYDLLVATRQYELSHASAVHSLIGLGSGLTPSGDDLLVGYLAGLWCTVRDDNQRVQFISSLGKTIIHLSEKTNDISRTYLYHAARGQVSSRLANLAGAICQGEKTEPLLEIAEAAMSLGHTSGMESVTGLLVGLSAWEGKRLGFRPRSGG